MGVQITTAFVQQYSTNVRMLLQQQGSRFRAHVREQACFGQAATYIEQFGKVSGVKNLARNMAWLMKRLAMVAGGDMRDEDAVAGN